MQDYAHNRDKSWIYKICFWCGYLGALWEYDRFYIHEGYHSYLTEEAAKYVRTTYFPHAGIGIFEVPVGATIYVNYKLREVISTDINYLGVLKL